MEVQLRFRFNDSLNLSYITATGNQAIGSNAPAGDNSCPGTGIGGGFFLEGATASLSDSLFQANLATGGIAKKGGVGWAGGVYTDKVNLTLDRVRFIGNIATSGGSNGGGAAGPAGGGAAYLAQFDGNYYHTTILNCLFAENKAVMGAPGANGGGGGGGVFIQGIAADVTHSTFVNNKLENGVTRWSRAPGNSLLEDPAAPILNIVSSPIIKIARLTIIQQLQIFAGNSGSLSYVWFGNNTSDTNVPSGIPTRSCYLELRLFRRVYLSILAEL